MLYLKFAWHMSIDAIGLARTFFWLPVCVTGLCIKNVLFMFGHLGNPRESPVCADHLPDVDKKGLRVMFTPSDNNAGSGAFRCMVELASLLMDRHGVDPFIIIPREGTGTQLLIERGLKYVMINSYDWTVPIGANMRQCRNSIRMIMKLLCNYSSVCALRRLIKRYDVDVVHVNTTWTYVGTLAAKSENVPCVYHLREYLEGGLNRTIWSRPIGNRLIASNDKIVAISKSIADKYRDIVPKSRLVMIFDGVDKVRFYCPKHKVLLNEPYTFVFLGSFSRNKGAIEFTKACARLYTEGLRNFKIWFIGAGNAEVRSECEDIFDNAGMNDIVTYYGFQKNPEKFLEKADVAFTCSQFEGWGRVTAEAMMAGCLAVGTDTGATPELIEDGRSGLIFHFEPEKSDALARTIKYLLANIDESRKMAEMGRIKALAEMTSILNAAKVYDLYLTLQRSPATSSKNSRGGGGK